MSEPLLLIHGFTGEPRSWEPLARLLAPHHELLSPATLGHCGGPPVPERLEHPHRAMLDALEADMDAAGWPTAHVVGSSLGGQLALGLAARGRARSVVALAPGGGWTEERAVERAGRIFRRSRHLTPLGARLAHALAARPGLRRIALRDYVAHPERIPPAVAEAMIRGAAECAIFDAIVDLHRDGRWRERDLPPLDVPVRVVWGTADRILPLEHASGHWREALRDAEWFELEGAGHLPWLDEPERVAELVLEVTTARAATGVAA